jgi:hypothetical protein
VNDAELRALVERNAQVQELTKHPGWELYCDFVRHRLAIEQGLLIRGNFDSLEDYKKKAGWVAGAIYALEAPDALMKLVESAHAPAD